MKRDEKKRKNFMSEGSGYWAEEERECGAEQELELGLRPC